MLVVQNLKNCLASYMKYGRHNKRWLYLGYMEACLVQFEVIESKDNGLIDYALLKSNGDTESREEILLRLTQQYLKDKK